MRLLLSAYACRPNAGSEPGCGWSWATHLAARGIEVHVLVAKRNQQAIEAGLTHQCIPNLHFTYVPVRYGWTRKNEALHYACWQAAALRVARELADKYRFHIAHHVTYASVHVPSQLWRLGIPAVFGPVGGGQTAPSAMLPYFGTEKAKEQFRTLITNALRLSLLHKYWLKRMSFVLAANRDTLDLVRAFGCENSEMLCDTAISADYLADAPRTFGERSDPLKLLWVGRMLPRKALPLALDALRRVRNNVTLTIAGDGLDPQLVHKMISDRTLQDKVFWQERRLTHIELRKAYAEHDAMLFTSLRDSFGSQLLEALGMGLPIITLDLHGAHDWVPDAASLKVFLGSREESVRNIAGAIDTYASFSPQRRNQMSMCAWTYAKSQTWSAHAEFCENLYNKILSRTLSQQSASASKVAVSVS